MKNVRYLKKLGLYTDDTVCIGKKYMASCPIGAPINFYITYYQPSKNDVIMIQADGSYEIFSFNSDNMTEYFRFRKINDVTFHMRSYCFHDYISMFKKKINFHGVEKIRIRFTCATEDDFGNYIFKFKHPEDAAVFQLYFSEFID